MEIPAARLAELPPGASFHGRSGRASVDVSRKGDTLRFYASCDSLQASWYRYPALCPVNRNAKGRPATPPQRVRVLRDGDQALLMWDKAEGRGGEATAYYVVYAFRSKQVGDLNDPANILARTHDNYLDLTTVPGFDPSGYHTFVVTSVNRYRRESVPTHAVTRKM